MVWGDNGQTFRIWLYIDGGVKMDFVQEISLLQHAAY